jgi:Tol biopolymer transport system component
MAKISLAVTAFTALVLVCVPAAHAAYPTAGNGRIVFYSQRDVMIDVFDVFVMGADGSGPRNLTPGDPVTAVDPSFSPDGARILFGGFEAGHYDVFSMNADGSAITNLTASYPTDDTGPALSPDGKKLAFGGDVDPGPDQNYDVFVANADGSGAVDITASRTTTPEFGPDFSPDGKRLIFRTFDGGDSDWFATGIDGSNPVNLTADNPGSDEDAVFTPDGTRIALARDVDPGPGTNYDIVLINAADGSGAVDITPGDGADRSPAPSPDGARIAFERAGRIFVAGIDGSGPANLTGSADGFVPRWEYVYNCAGRRATLIGSDSAEKIKGTKGADVIVGNGGNDKLLGRGGKDRICGGTGKDKLKGGAGNDRLLGQAGKDTLTGGKGDDVLKGGKGKDVERQ